MAYSAPTPTASTPRTPTRNATAKRTGNELRPRRPSVESGVVLILIRSACSRARMVAGKPLHAPHRVGALLVRGAVPIGCGDAVTVARVAARGLTSPVAGPPPGGSAPRRPRGGPH